MCGRFTLTPSDFDRIADILGARYAPEEAALHRPRYNVAPMQETWILEAEAGERTLRRARWGLVNRWAKDDGWASRQINARAETLATSRAYRDAFLRRRCAVPADGFYEWKGEKGRKQPYRIHRRDEGLLLFAGLYEDWTPPGGRPLRTFTIVTTDAAGAIRDLHDRMPAILAPEQLPLWLAPLPKEGAVDALLDLLKPRDPKLAATPVSARVNSVANDDPECAAPAEKAQGSLFG